MRLHATMTPQEWKDLLGFLSARGCKLTSFPETDQKGLFVDWKFALVEYHDEFYYLQGNRNFFEPFTVCRYSKISPYIRHQNDYPKAVCDTDELLAYMNEAHVQRPFKDTHDQRIFNLYTMHNGYTDLWHLENRLANNREKNILSSLESITTLQHTHDYHVLRFHSIDGNFFDYEINSRKITG